MAVRSQFTSICLMFLLLCSALLATTLQGVQGEVDVEGPSESECRPYIEKALKKLETGDTQSAEVQDDVAHIVTTDDSETQGDSLEITTEAETSKSAEDETQDDGGKSAEETEGAESVEEATAAEEQDASAETGDTQEVSAEQTEETAEEKEEGEATEEVADESAEKAQSTEQEDTSIEKDTAEAQSEEKQEETEEQQASAEDTTAEQDTSKEGEGEQDGSVEKEESKEQEGEKEASAEQEGSQEQKTEESLEQANEPQGEESAEQATESAEQAEESAEQAAESAEQATESGEQAAESAEQAAESAEQGAESAEQTAESAEQDTESAEQAAESTEQGAESAEPNAESGEQAAESAEQGAESAEQGAESAEQGAESAEQGAESAEQGAESAEQGAESTEDAEASEDHKEHEVDSEQDASAEKQESVEEEQVEKASAETVEASAEKQESGEQAESTEKEDKSEGDAEKEADEASAEKTESGEQEQADEAASKEESEGEESTEAAETEPTPEEDLTWEIEIPTDLRPREHIDDILHLDEESGETDKLIEKAADSTLKELKRIYENAIKPLETLYKYRDLSNRHFGDPEIFSKPLVLFMGPWSGGKSSIINYLLDNEYTEMSLRTGAEPSPAYFNLLMWGEEPEVLDGTQLAADWTFSGLQKFGQGLEERLRGLKLPNKLLEKVNIVEIPGILEVRKQVSRMFPFNDACQWFIDRADIIFLVYDPSKLDVGPETEAILDQLKGREYQTRIILNKADQVKPEELMRVQGSLIWNISPLMSSAQPPVMYSTSLWSKPYEIGAPVRLLQAQERAFLKDLKTAIDKRIENKISSARRFAVRVRNHAKMVDCYLTTYYNHKSVFGNKKLVADQIIEHPQDYHIYEGLSTLTNISRYDLPDPDVYRDFFRLNPLYDFQQLSATCTYFRGCPINRLDVAIAYDLPELVGKYKKMVEAITANSNTESTTKS